MQKLIFSAVFGVWAVFGAVLPAAYSEGAIAPKDGVIRLFDGRSLKGFYVWMKDAGRGDPDRVFRVENGVIHVTGQGLGALVTNQSYRDYHLVLEFKWGKRTWAPRERRARDSGLLVHSQGADGGHGGTWMPSIEVQIIEGGVGDFVPVPGADSEGAPVPISFTCEVRQDRDGEFVWHPSGERQTFAGKSLQRVNWFGRDPDWKDELGVRGPDDVDSPSGRWTRLDVICDGGRIQTFVNGTKVNEASDVSPRVGQLQLQTELAEIYFRRWELWPLDKAPAPAPPAEETKR